MLGLVRTFPQLEQSHEGFLQDVFGFTMTQPQGSSVQDEFRRLGFVKPRAPFRLYFARHDLDSNVIDTTALSLCINFSFSREYHHSVVRHRSAIPPVLLGDGRGAREPIQVSITKLIGFWRSDLQSSGVVGVPDLGMTIPKVESEIKIMAMCGKRGEIKPRVGPGVRDKKAVIDAALIFVDQDP